MAQQTLTTVESEYELRKDYFRKWYLSRKDLYKERHLKRTYGMTIADLISLLEKQEYKCGVCEEDLTHKNPKNVHIDHCHDSNKIRGVLCNSCNMALGLLKDNIKTLEKAVKYIKDEGCHSKH